MPPKKRAPSGSQSSDEGLVDSTHGHGGTTMVTGIKEYPLTFQRPPYVPTQRDLKLMGNPGTARANVAPSRESPNGTTKDNFAESHTHQTVLQQHCEFFDNDRDGIIWPLDTFRGFHAIGFNVILSIFAMFIIHMGFAYTTSPSIFPDPFFRIYLNKIHKTKHGSDTGTYDNEGRYIPQKFEDFFNKYANGKDGMDKRDLWNGISAQRVVFDPFGSTAEILEWTATYLMIWPADGIIRKEEARKVYDGSIFYEYAAMKRSGIQSKQDRRKFA
ncbi:hypothetical protein RUND412_006243 [Rhizina undulata]